MNLTRTEQLLKKLQNERFFDSYGVAVGLRGDECFLHSENVNADTYFDIASMGKVLVTAPLIFQLIGQKKVSLDDTLERFFSDVPAEKREITVRQLLTHTSGIVRIPLPAEIAEKGHDALAAHILAAPLAFAPGKGQQYSCNAYILLGFIAEKQFGMPLDVAFEIYIKKPLGLTRSRFNIRTDEENAAACYERELVGDWRVDDCNVYNMKGVAGSGASFWTMRDIQTYIRAVMRKSEKLFPAVLYDLAERDYVGALGESWGLGFLYVDSRYPQTADIFPVGSFGHCGHTGQSFFINREKDLYAVILTNATRFLNMRSGFKGYDYGEIEKMRAMIHHAIAEDLAEYK